MSVKANYFKLGLFVIAATVLLLAGVVFFGGRALTREIVYMETYLDESVEGLEVGSPMNYRGVRIGRVDSIGFVADEYRIKPGTPEFETYGRYVMVVVAIDVSTEDERRTADLLTEFEKQGLRVRLKSHALTGVAYLEADYMDPGQNPPMSISWTPRHRYLSSAPSIISTFTATAEDAFRKLGRIDIEKLVKVTEKLIVTLESAVVDARVGEVSTELQTLLATVNTAVKDARVDEVSSNLKKLIAALEIAVKEAHIGEIRKGVTDLLATADATIKAARIGDVSTDVRGLLAEVRQTNTHLQTLLKTPKGAATATVGQTIANLDKVIVRLDQMLKREGPGFSRAAADIATVAEQLKKLVDDLERNPARLLFGGPPAKSRKVKP